MAMVDDSSIFMIDEAYEFSAPGFFDFIEGETAEEMRRAELWFDTALSYAPSPFVPKIKTSRTVQLESLCDFSEAEQTQKAPESLESTATSGSETASTSTLDPEKKQTIPQPELSPVQVIEELIPEGNKAESRTPLNPVTANEMNVKVKKGVSTQENKSVLTDDGSSSVKFEPLNGQEACTPILRMNSQKDDLPHTDSKRQQTSKKIASMLRNPSTLKSTNQSKLSQARSIKPESVRRNANLINKVGTHNFALENQPIKRQKLEGGKTRQILNNKPQTLPHKTRPGLISGNSSLCPSAVKTRKEDRRIYAWEPAAPFISMAEMIKKFQSNTRDISISCASSSLSHDAAGSVIWRKPKLTLTRPEEPEFETSQRVRSVRVKSSAELEEEMMAKIPKFKARPINRNILEAPRLPTLPRSTPQLPEFQEFHLETMARANRNAETSAVASLESVSQNQQCKPNLTTPKPPTLHTFLRARPPWIKSSEELEKEELEKIPKFKARPLNKKIFESKGELGVFCNAKRQVTVPQEFHFAIDERIPPPATFAGLFAKLSLNSEPHRDKQLPRNSAPNPFNLLTEERGVKKEYKFVMEVIQKQLEEESARVPKATPYPYTTDYPVVPPKPEPKPCTKPEPFQLESLVRHEEEMQREMEERQRMERKEARMRLFKAQPVLKEDPIPAPEKVRKPLTEVQEFDLHVEHRAIDRAEFGKKIKEKGVMYKRYREEAESEKMMEEEKALKQLRRTLAPHARPVPNFNHPFLPQKSSKQATKPKSPKLKIHQRKEKRKMISTIAATSSAASNMR